ncbi:MAG TPA: MarR family transcriptional regulator [Mycobacterium sp.]|uniref:MarR family winged helix-turn-helix transcriptional regulator n=1 Tax=Mycobacterium sp. TaxID=1785 RepID=UPI002D70BEE0|nr:MarR family transcriptional regulator [Mycobacterium sp.]HZU48903.1 MarR family transcriptional regulator [Mycobacterium sp.]
MERDSQNREHIVAALHAAARLRVRHLAHGQSLTSSSVLARLADDGPTRLTVLADASGVSQPAMTQLVARLEREGLVARLPDPEDRRATLVEISGRGRTFLSELRKSLDDRLVGLLKTLSADDEATLALAMRVALPRIQQLIEEAAQQPRSAREPTPLMS